MERNILVFGATGKTGQEICKELSASKLAHSSFVRPQSKEKLKDASSDIIEGDVMNLDNVKTAFENKTYTDVIIALGSKDLKGSGIRSIGTQNIVDALNANQSNPQIHCISALGVGESWSQLKWHAKLISNLLIKKTMNDHNAQELAIIKSTIPYHIIRPVALKDGPSSGEVHVQNEGFLPKNSIQRTDVAKYLVKSLLEKIKGVSGICQK